MQRGVEARPQAGTPAAHRRALPRLAPRGRVKRTADREMRVHRRQSLTAVRDQADEQKGRFPYNHRVHRFLRQSIECDPLPGQDADSGRHHLKAASDAAGARVTASGDPSLATHGIPLDERHERRQEMTARRQHPASLPCWVCRAGSARESRRAGPPEGRAPAGRIRPLAAAADRGEGGRAGRGVRAVERRRRLASPGWEPRAHHLPRPRAPCFQWFSTRSSDSGMRSARDGSRFPVISWTCSRAATVHGPQRPGRGQAQACWAAAEAASQLHRRIAPPHPTSLRPGQRLLPPVLDEEMVYTCAYYDTPDATLEQAQCAKFDHVCRKLMLRPGQQVIEAGCGWGTLALHMAREYGVKVRAFNISQEQIAYARERRARDGMDGMVSSCRTTTATSRAPAMRSSRWACWSTSESGTTRPSAASSPVPSSPRPRAHPQRRPQPPHPGQRMAGAADLPRQPSAQPARDDGDLRAVQLHPHRRREPPAPLRAYPR